MTYTFRNKKTGKIEEHVMRVSEYDTFKSKNPHLERYFDDPPALSYGGVGDTISKTDNTFKEVMQKIAEQNPRSPLADRFGQKSTKRIKTDQVLDTHSKLQAEKRRSNVKKKQA